MEEYIQFESGFAPHSAIEDPRGHSSETVARLREARLLAPVDPSDPETLDAHPLVRRGFENVLGTSSSGAAARAGFLRGRPDRKTPVNLA